MTSEQLTIEDFLCDVTTQRPNLKRDGVTTVPVLCRMCGVGVRMYDGLVIQIVE